MLDPSRPLLLVGGGKMGEALLGGWLDQGLLPPAAVHVVEPDAGRRALLRDGRGVACATGAEELPAGLRPGALLLAIKPQMMAAALPAYAGRVAPDTLVLSIAAGKPIASFEAVFGAGQGIVRAMPNTPAAVGRGTSVLCANAAATGSRTRIRCTPSPLFPAAARPMSST